MSLEANQSNGCQSPNPTFGLAGASALPSHQQRAFLDSGHKDTFQSSKAQKKAPWYTSLTDPTVLITGIAGITGLVGLGLFLRKNPEAAAKSTKKELEQAVKRKKSGGGGSNRVSSKRVGKFQFLTTRNGKITIREVEEKNGFDYKTLEYGVKSTSPRDYKIDKPEVKTVDAIGNESVDSIKTDGKRYTTDYLGQNQNFYDDGYRWGISLGRDHKSFLENGVKKGIVDEATGRLTLDDGRYLIAIKANGEVVIGRETRGAHNLVLDQYQPGQPLAVDGIKIYDGENDIRKFVDGKAVKEKVPVKEILDVPNHSVLTGRGQKLVAGENEREFAAHFAGEVRVHNGQIVWANNQSGQFFGPASKNRFNLHNPDDKRKLVDADERNEFALARAKRHFERLTGSKNEIDAIKVNFGDLPADHNRLTAFRDKPVNIKIPKHRLAAFHQNLDHPGMEQLLTGLEYFPWKMKSMLVALPDRTPQELDTILKFMNEQIDKEALKDFQAARMAAAMISRPKSVALFMDMPLAGHTLNGSYSNVVGLTANTKAKMVGTYEYLTGKMGVKLSFDEFITQLDNSPNLLSLMGSFRNSGGFLDEILFDIPKAERFAQDIHQKHQLPDQSVSQTIHNLAQHANSVYPTHKLQAIEYAKNLSDLEIQALSNEVGRLKTSGDESLADTLATKEKELKEILADRAASDNDIQALQAQIDKFSHQAIQADREVHDLVGPTVDLESFYKFAYDKFQLRWTNDHILLAHLLKQEEKDPAQVSHFANL